MINIHLHLYLGPFQCFFFYYLVSMIEFDTYFFDGWLNHQDINEKPLILDDIGAVTNGATDDGRIS